MRYLPILRCLAVGWLCLSGGLTATAQQAAVDASVETAEETAVIGADTESTDSDESAAIEAAIQSYVAAFNTRDVAKLVNHWSPEGVYTSRTTGEKTVGREAIEAAFKATFANNENLPNLAVSTSSIDFVSPNVALERGTATVTRSTEDVAETDYSVVYVKRDGVWLIDRVTEEEIVVEPTHFEQLQVLEWLIGDWFVEDQGFRLELSCQWTAKQNFISCQYKVFAEEEVESSGLQVIGWDAHEKKIRSWLFDSDGGVVTGTWNKRDTGWAVQSVATLGDGGSGSFTSIFRLQEDGNFGWEKINQVLDGKLLPNIDEMVFLRR